MGEDWLWKITMYRVWDYVRQNGIIKYIKVIKGTLVCKYIWFKFKLKQSKTFVIDTFFSFLDEVGKLRNKIGREDKYSSNYEYKAYFYFLNVFVYEYEDLFWIKVKAVDENNAKFKFNVFGNAQSYKKYVLWKKVKNIL